MAVAGSWLLLAALTTAVFIVHVVRIAIGRRTESSEELPAYRELMAFQGVFFTMMLVSSVVPFALPLIVVGTVGTTQNAYFNLAWTMNAAGRDAAQQFRRGVRGGGRATRCRRAVAGALNGCSSR